MKKDIIPQLQDYHKHRKCTLRINIPKNLNNKKGITIRSAF